MKICIRKIDSAIHVDELPAVARAFVVIYKKFGALSSQILLSMVIAEIETLSQKAQDALKGEKTVSNLDEKDAVRDAAVRDLDAILTGYASFPMPKKKEAAQVLRAIFAKYGRAAVEKNYLAESTLIESMLSDFGSDAAVSAIKELDGVGEQISALRAAEDDFKAAQDSLNSAAAAEKGKESATIVKKALLSCINDKFISFVNAAVLIDEASYGSFASEIEVAVNQANDRVYRHRSIKR